MVTHPDADINIEERADNKRCITIIPKHKDMYAQRRTWVTAYPVELIQEILDVKGPAYLCDEIMREEDPSYLRPHLELTILAHVAPETYFGKRILDFGCGCGASTIILSRLLPYATIMGVELERRLLDVAQLRAEYTGCHNISFVASSGPDTLPDTMIGDFDAIVLSAVYEHLMPAERAPLLQQLWSRLKPSGILFIDETPYRWFPIETHTTGLPFINILPDRFAYVFARLLSKRVDQKGKWESLLRIGIRGGTIQEILSYLHSPDHQPLLLKPSRLCIHSHVELWYRGYAAPGSGRYATVKRWSVPLLKFVSAVLKTPFVPYLSLAVKKVDT
ncbi:MAG: class I SAM-dependent methyltransferase [Proteobacteria bacterium]|nr:class I SAM-dependent methyltransferase [Pseudomonadota bacterium]